MEETQETQVRSLHQEDPLEEVMAAYSGVLAWRAPWMGRPGGLRSVRLQGVGHDWSDVARMHEHRHRVIIILFTIEKRWKQLMSINRWINKQNAVYTYSEMLFSHKNQWSSDTCYNFYEPWKFIPHEMSDTKGQIFCDHLYKMYRIVKFMKTECRLEVTEACGGNG